MHFDVSTKGKADNIAADCTNTYFCSTAVQALNRVEFAPKIVNSVAVPRTNITYPMEIRANPDELVAEGGPSLEPFDSDAPLLKCPDAPQT